ncbi:TrmH family RNA methyltransferase [Amycolatopsis pithecellobii]|uniref:RNA methyltransferase n=1 Tax=Amycolatopsis pithecellobii TaxID=664692 RepID=A0A6N7YWC6_9PSEU|nr:RNA methyltransferase [Amycolatopsis pithecellobii]MTD57387.1 RNA methyltransferase [Amycolatopsis pithecellobii]
MSENTTRPGAEPFTQRSPRVVAARRLTRRAEREKAGRFLAEGANAVGAALAGERGLVHELFVTADAAEANPELVSAARAAGARVSPVTDRAAAALSETVTPQGIVAVCELLGRSLDAVLPPAARLVAVLVDVADPGNAGTVIRVADAAGADAVILAGDSVDPHNGKCVRASAGSLFHVPLARTRDAHAALEVCRAAGLRLFGADGYAKTGLDSLALDVPAAWVFGNEAHGLPGRILESVDEGVRIPIYGQAESLNLATAAAVCLYGSAMALSPAERRSSGG